MPLVYLSPSTQQFNPYAGGGNEEFWMNRIADELEPYLTASGIDFIRNSPEMTARTSIEQSNNVGADLHVAIHSNASPDNLSGLLQGTDIYYYPTSRGGQRMAELLQDNFRSIYPDPEKVNVIPTTSLGEVRETAAPSVLIETAYHDNEEDADWIRNNTKEIAREIARAITDYFGVPLVES
ncbi:MAG: N-acetylmuramoyl-L-alanine amidase [Clostridia bacterium]|nr:N-acetylmuramoyl-L-alanine amidase [Clostridia bacterium]